MSDITHLKDRLRLLSEAMAVSGAEDEVRRLVLDAIRDKALHIQIDPMGSITALRKGTDASDLHVMVCAHMDEIGFMVTSIDDDGLISVEGIGKHDLRQLPALRVMVGKERTPGVVLWTPIHKNKDQKMIEADDLQIDVGASSKDNA